METYGRTGKELIAFMLANKERHGVVDPVESYREAIGKLSIDFSLLHFILERMSWGVWDLEETLGMYPHKGFAHVAFGRQAY